MRNSKSHASSRWHAVLAVLTLALGARALADDPSPPAPATPAKKVEAPSATPPPANKSDTDDDEGADYEKNAARRFTPTERTPADRNVSFPVDI